MNHKKKLTLLTGFTILLLIAILSCASEPIITTSQQQEMKPLEMKETSPAPKQEITIAQTQTQIPASAPEVKQSSPYDMDIKPLTPAECARCHYSVFTTIKNEGGKHKIECVRCHTKFHAYNPKKQNWDEIMPKCETCHGLIHGQKFTDCGSCHGEPHAPKLQIAISTENAQACAECHAQVGQELQANISKHTQVACNSCHHGTHGYIPSCMECHKPHTPTLTVKECLACHPVHNPLKISYALTTPNDICGSCHGVVYQKLQDNRSKHSLLACASCHSKHKFIPKCESCHSQVHGEAMLKKFPDCAQCHLSAHDLPSKSIEK